MGIRIVKASSNRGIAVPQRRSQRELPPTLGRGAQRMVDWVLQLVSASAVESSAKSTTVRRRGRRAEDPLLQAAESGNYMAVADLLDRGLNPNVGRTTRALHRAAGEGHVRVVELLLGHGADPNIRDRDGNTPLHLAAGNFWRKGGQLPIANLLIRHGADINAYNKRQWTPLHCCALIGECDLAELLIKHGADPQTRTAEGWTPLYLAERDKRIALVTLLRRKLWSHGARGSGVAKAIA